MIRKKIIFLFSMVILVTALGVYFLTKNAYHMPVRQAQQENIPVKSAPDIVAQPVLAAERDQKEVDVSLRYAGAEKSDYFALLEFSLPEGTKTYWKKAGFGGINPELDVSDSENLHDVEIFWGTPQKLTSSGVINYVLGKNPKILMKITPDKLSQDVHLKGKFHYGYCDIQCKAGTKDIDLVLNSDDVSDISVADRYDLMKTEPVPLDEKKSPFKIFDFKEKIDRKSHIISFTFEADEPFREENFFYNLDINDYEIIPPLIQNIYEGRRRITLDMVGLPETPKEIEVIYKSDDGKTLIKKSRLNFERYN